MMLLKVFHFCLILISSQTLADWNQERIRYNNTFQNGVDCFSGPLFWTTCGYEQSRDILNNGPASFPMVNGKVLEFNPLLYGGANVDNLREVDGYSNGFDINQMRAEMQQIRAEMQQIRAECNCKKNDYNYNLDSNDYYDD